MKNADLKKTEYSMICALCIAISAAVQTAFSSFGSNCAVYFSVLLCAVCCPLKYGILCAIICPLFAMMTAGEPTVVLLPAGIVKCLSFVLLSRLLLSKFNTGKIFKDLYICLVPSVCIGQCISGLICGTVFCGDADSLILFVVEELIAAIPEIIFLLAIVPGTVSLLNILGISDNRLFRRDVLNSDDENREMN